MEFILSNDLAICNRGNEPIFVTVNRQEAVDITLVSSKFIQKTSDWKSFNLVEQVENPTTALNIRKVNWSQYVKTFNRLIQKPSNECENSCGYRRGKQWPPWWSSEVKKAQYKSWVYFCSNVEDTFEASMPRNQ